MIDLNKVLENIFGPLINYLLSKHIYGAFVFIILFVVYLYFTTYRKKRFVWRNYDWYEKLEIIAFVFILLFSIVMQIDMIDKAMRGQ